MIYIANLQHHLSRNVILQHVLQGILTPDGELIKNQILDVKGISIKNSAPSCNTCFADWITGDHVGSKLT